MQQYLPFTVLKLDAAIITSCIYQLQQYLPFTVLKLNIFFFNIAVFTVATVLTVYGIETMISFLKSHLNLIEVATVLTVYGIETSLYGLLNKFKELGCNSTYRLRYWNIRMRNLQNVLLWSCNSTYRLRYWNRKEELIKQLQAEIGCNSTYRLRYWNLELFSIFRSLNFMEGCNSTYRLRYWNALSKYS